LLGGYPVDEGADGLVGDRHLEKICRAAVRQVRQVLIEAKSVSGGG